MRSDKRISMEKRIIKFGSVMILFISIFIFALNPDLLKIVEEAGRKILEMLHEFVKRDVVGIV